MFGLFKKKKQEDEAMTMDEKDIAKADKDVADDKDTEQTKSDEVDESVGEQEHLDGDENSQDAKDRVHESEATKNADEERAKKEDEAKDDKKDDEAMQALVKRLVTLEEQLTELMQRTAAAVEQEKSQDFGLSAQSAPSGADDENSRYNMIMRGYAGADAHKYN